MNEKASPYPGGSVGREEPITADQIGADDPQKVQKLAKLGHKDDEPDPASE